MQYNGRQKQNVVDYFMVHLLLPAHTYHATAKQEAPEALSLAQPRLEGS